MYTQLTILAFASLALAAFGLRELTSGQQVSDRIQKQGSSPFLGHFPMEFAYWVLGPVGKLAAYFQVSPNFFSWSCLLIGVGAGVAAALGEVPLAGGLSLVSAVFDALDGMVARRRGVASDAGEVLDAAVDRYTEFFFLAGLSIYYRFEPWAMVVVLIALLGSFMVSYSQAKAEALRVLDIPKGWMRRPERAVYLGVGAFLSPIVNVWADPATGAGPSLHVLVLLSVVLVAVFSNITAIHRFSVLYRRLDPQQPPRP